MNERIRLLAEQSGLGHERWNTTEQFEQFMNKFAELIVRECAAICDSLQDIPATEPRHCAEDIRIHFGVEE